MPVQSSPGQETFFEKKVFPLLQQHCFECHGKDVQHGQLRLDAKQIVFQGGKHGPALVPGNPDKSLLFQRLITDDKKQRMPLGKKPLSKDEINVIQTWIENGGVWKKGLGDSIEEVIKHWAFEKPVQATPPITDEDRWNQNPIDAFVFEKLKKNGLEPSPPEARKKLIRRMYLDVIGLPPNLNELEKYAYDQRLDWDEHLIDDLLSSPHYGEKWGRHWLDAVRYADTNGYEKDRHRDIWAYRDYVIDSFNKNKPFDQFTIEQLAGDLLPNAGLEQLIATGFHRNTMHNEEGGVEVEEFRFESIIDRVNTTANVFLGLTVACAQCHTHKYDPITHNEYYQFFAYFNNCDEVAVKIPNKEVEQQRKEIKQKIQSYLSTLDKHFPATDMQTVWENILPTNYATIEGVLLHEDNGYLHSNETHHNSLTYLLTVRPNQNQINRIRFTFLHPQNESDIVLSVLKNNTLSNQSESKSISVLDRHTVNPTEMVFVFEDSIVMDKDSYFQLRIETNGALQAFKVDLGLKARIPVPEHTDHNQLRKKRFDQQFQTWIQSKKEQSVKWKPLIPQKMETLKHALLKELPDHSILAYGDMPNNDIYTVTYQSPLKRIQTLQLSALRDPSLPGEGPGRGTVLQDGNFMLSEFTVEVVKGNKVVREVEIESANATSHTKNATAGYAIDGDHNTGWSIQKNPLQLYQAIFTLKKPIQLNAGEQLRITLNQNYIHTYTLGRFKISVSSESKPSPTGLPEMLESRLAFHIDLKEHELSLLHYYFMLDTPELTKQQKELASLVNSIPPHTTTLVVRERDKSRITRVHHRGEYLQPKDTVQPGVMSVLHSINMQRDSIPPRLKMAKWLVNRENPLTARVTVNRIWMRYFGRGIVETVDDFGTRGSLPSHPELLDWLAIEFMEQGWNLKHIHRLILSSATYQQSAMINENMTEIDPDNEWYARGPRFRLDAELVRDTALSISGLLSSKIGGPSVFPPMPDGMGALSYGRFQWKTDTGKNRYRRGMYTYWKRTNPYPMMTTFDAPTANTSCVRRNRSNTPLQALTLLNDTVFMEAAQALAYRVLTEKPGSLTDKLCFAFELCTSRKPNEKEVGSLLRYYGKQYLRIYNSEIDPVSQPIDAVDLTRIDPVQWRAWTLVSRVLLNLDETVSK